MREEAQESNKGLRDPRPHRSTKTGNNAEVRQQAAPKIHDQLHLSQKGISRYRFQALEICRKTIATHVFARHHPFDISHMSP